MEARALDCAQNVVPRLQPRVDPPCHHAVASGQGALVANRKTRKSDAYRHSDEAVLRPEAGTQSQFRGLRGGTSSSETGTSADVQLSVADRTSTHAKLLKELWEAAVGLRGSIEPADYKRYVLPIIFLRFLSTRYDERREALRKMIDDPESPYFTRDQAIAAGILSDPDEYLSEGAFLIPDDAHWVLSARGLGRRYQGHPR